MRANPLLSFSLLALLSTLHAANFHVAPNGDDRASDNAAEPFTSLDAARHAARALAGRESVAIYDAAGTNFLPKALQLTPAGLEIDQLFINGQRQRMARYANLDANKPTAAYQGSAADVFSPERAARLASPAGGRIHALHKHRWGGHLYFVTGKHPDRKFAYDGGWQKNRQTGMHDQFRIVENIFEELDADCEWFHEAKTINPYYQPGPRPDRADGAAFR